MKHCNVCKIYLTEENKQKRYARCKTCHASIVKDANKIYREDNQEEIAVYQKKYKSENKEKVNARSKNYRDNHKPQLIIAQQERRLRASGLTEDEKSAITDKWDKWYPNYVIYQKSKDQKYEYEISLTI